MTYPLRVALAATALSLALPAAAAEDLSALPGGVVRWAAPDTSRCSMPGLSFDAIGGACYFPIDVLQKPGVISVTRHFGEGRKESARVRVEPRNYGEKRIDLPDVPQAHPSAADEKRNQAERVTLAKVFGAKAGSAQFTLPLGKPARPMPKGEAFGVSRVFDGKPAAQPHMGTDYPVPVDSPVLAMADGTVVLAEDLFYPGQSVIIDHGHGLMTLYFHLSAIKAQVGESVKKGAPVGKVGSTGRSTRPHLFFGVRWHNARIDPKWVLEDPARMPTMTKETTSAAK